MNLDDLYALLLSHEMRIEQKRGKPNSNVVHNLIANFTKKKNQGSPKNVFGNQKGNRNFDTFNSGMSSL